MGIGVYSRLFAVASQDLPLLQPPPMDANARESGGSRLSTARQEPMCSTTSPHGYWRLFASIRGCVSGPAASAATANGRQCTRIGRLTPEHCASGTNVFNDLASWVLASIRVYSRLRLRTCRFCSHRQWTPMHANREAHA